MQPSTSCNYAPRAASALGVFSFEDWSVKPYRILGRSAAADSPLHPSSVAVIGATLPRPAVTPRRPGIAFVIEHLATPLDYIVLCWWDNANEMITRVFVRGAGEPWRPTAGNESFCVWDLDIMWFERNAFVRTMLEPGTPNVEAYLQARFAKPSAG
ncbi:MAG: isochorismatase [Planctomycetes bacterium]|nr:isochorismatase [Planctomycetota bacterium]